MTLFQGKYRVESARLRDWDYAAGGWYFVTICTALRKCWFGNIEPSGQQLSAIGIAAEEQWRAIPSHYKNIKLDAFSVMPNHVHGIIIIDGEHPHAPRPHLAYRTLGLAPPAAGSLSAVVRSYKAGVTRWCRANGHSTFAWQSRFHDHIIRGNREVGAVREYIRQNPENWLRDEFHPSMAQLET